jgi:hypothetical protein
MRTKTLLLSALLGVAGAASATAQNVYSVNAVGYVNVAFPQGFSIRANPLNATPNNALGNIFDAAVVPLGTKLYRYDTSVTPATFRIYTFDTQDDESNNWGTGNAVALNPGEGFFVKATAAFTNTFVGEVPQGAASNQAVKQGFALKSSVVPQSGRLDTVLGYPAELGDKVYRLNPDGKTYKVSTFEEGDEPGSTQWTQDPTLIVGEGFWLLSKSNKDWNRNFSVNQ